MGQVGKDQPDGLTSRKWKRISVLSKSTKIASDEAQRLVSSKKRKLLVREDDGGSRTMKRGNSGDVHATEATQSTTIEAAAAID